jgi:hypothetical protein
MSKRQKIRLSGEGEHPPSEVAIIIRRKDGSTTNLSFSQYLLRFFNDCLEAEAAEDSHKSIDRNRLNDQIVHSIVHTELSRKYLKKERESFQEYNQEDGK